MKKTISTHTFVAAPRDVVFETFTNHNSYKQLAGVRSSTLLKEGAVKPSNGVGAIREVRGIGLALKEEVTACNPPFSWEYQFHQWPSPVPHAGGKISFEEVEGGTMVHWDTSYSTDVPWHLKLTFPLLSLQCKAIIAALPRMLGPIAVKNNAKNNDGN